LGLASLPAAVDPGAERGMYLLQEALELQASLQLVTLGWETDPRRPTILGLSHNTPALHPAHSRNHSIDVHPTSDVIHLILSYSCDIHPQCWLFFLVFTGMNLWATLTAAATPL